MPDRKPLISGNWKMHHNHFEAIQFTQKLAFNLSKDDFEAVDVSIHPPFTDLRSVQITIDDQKATAIALGAQNCHWEEKGAFTGATGKHIGIFREADGGTVMLDEVMGEVERRLMLEALERTGGVRKTAAQLLGITFRSLRYRLEKHHLDPGDAGDAAIEA